MLSIILRFYTHQHKSLFIKASASQCTRISLAKVAEAKISLYKSHLMAADGN